MADQSVFQDVYRGRQSALHHAAYMRMAKVLLIQEILRQANVTLNKKSIFDYGFGAGTFYRYCPANCQLFGVEMDLHNVRDVSEMLLKRGYKQVRLEAIDIACWEQHPLLGQTYDLVICSHVLEHLTEPVSFLKRIKKCLKPGGFFLGLVPINELKENPYHEWQLNESMICKWVSEAGMRVFSYLETDHIGYHVQPAFCYSSGVMHRISQIVSLGYGLPATLMGHRLWWTFSRIYGIATRARPSQAAFLAL